MTLLEVMAAVAIVAIVFTTLARVASQGLQSEGTSRRRFEASLLADSTLADIEDGIALGTTPELGTTENDSEDGVYTVYVDVTAFDLAAAVPLPAETEAAAAGLTPTPDFSLAGAVASGAAESPIRQIEITVAWNEGTQEQSVFRTTYGLDQAAIQAVLGSAVQNLDAAGAAPPGTADAAGAGGAAP